MALRILSLDGGGYRGRLTALMLDELQQAIDAACRVQGRASKQLVDCFDLIAGTSTGSLIAASLALGKSTAEILKIYDVDGELLFPRQGLLSLLGRVLSRPIFDGTNLNKVLTKHLGDLRMGQLQKAVLITAYDPWNNRPLVLRSYDPSCHNIRLFDACRGSSAYPGAFPAHRLREEEDGASALFDKLREERSYFSYDHSCEGGKGIPLIDGGIGASNPAAITITKNNLQDLNNWLVHQGGQERSEQEVVLVSFGTGQKPPDLNYSAGRRYSLGRWVSFLGNPLLEMMFVSYSKSFDQICRNQLGEDNFYRFQPSILRDQIEKPNAKSNVVLISDKEAKVFDKATFQATPDVDALFNKICASYFNKQKPTSSNQPFVVLQKLAERLVGE